MKFSNTSDTDRPVAVCWSHWSHFGLKVGGTPNSLSSPFPFLAPFVTFSSFSTNLLGPLMRFYMKLEEAEVAYGLSLPDQ